MKFVLSLAAGILFLVACSSPKVTNTPQPVQGHVGRLIGGAPTELPRAVIYKTNGDYTDFVPVTLNSDGSLRSYPAPSDINDSSTPLSVADGFLLDRRGVSENTVFTRWTYTQYASLTTTPSPDSIIANIIPGSAIIQIEILPIERNQAIADTSSVNRLIKAGLR